MRFIVKWIILSIVATSSWVAIAAQTLEQTFNYAEQQLALGWNDRAEKAYKRVLFFDTENRFRGQCMEALADLALEKDQYQDALNYLDQAYFLSRDLQQQNEYQTKRIRIYLETNQVQKALTEIYQTDETFDTSRIKVYEAYCQYWLKDFDAMEAALQGLMSTAELSQIRKRAEKIERMNPKFYQTMSYLIPGLGQVLLGDLGQSVNSMLLSAGLATLFIHTAKRLTFFDAVISVIPWFYRYYSGGAKLTRQLAIEKKMQRHKENVQDLLTKIQSR